MSALDVIRITRAAGAKLIVDGCSLVLEGESPPPAQVFDMLRKHKPEILELLQAERRAVVRYIATHFRSSPPGRCALCGDGKREDDTFVLVFVGEDRADLHASCHPAWVARQEAEARVALGIETPVDIRPECDVADIETSEK